MNATTTARPKPVTLTATADLTTIQDAQQDRQHLHGVLVGWTNPVDGGSRWTLGTFATETEAEVWREIAVDEADRDGIQVGMIAYLPPMVATCAMADDMRRARLIAARDARLAARAGA